MPGLFQKPSANPLFPDQAQLPQVRPEIPALPGQVPVNFNQWEADPVNLIKIGQQPRTAQAQVRPELPPEAEPQVPAAPITAGPAPNLAAPAPPAFDASGIMPKRPEQQQLSRGQNVGMALSTIADSIGAALTHTAPTVGPQRLQRMNDVDVAQRAYDQNAPKLQYDLKQQVTKDALGNAATAAGTAHTQQVTKNLGGQLSPQDQRKAQFMDEWSKNAEGGKYSPDALKAAVKRAAQYHGVAMSDGDIDSLAGIKPLGAAFSVKDEGGYPVAIVRRDGSTLPANSPQLTPEEKDAINGYNSAVTAKETRQDARDNKRAADSDARLNKTLAASLRRQNDKPPSESERQSFAFYTRAASAAKTLDELDPLIAGQGLMSSLQMKGPNIAQSDAQQQYNQARLQLTQAKLRKESGAAISQSEYDQDANTYFPQPGDSADVLKQKSAARKELVKELKIQSGRAYTQSFGDAEQGGSNSAAHIVHDGSGKRIGTATDEQRKKGEYTPD